MRFYKSVFFAVGTLIMLPLLSTPLYAQSCKALLLAADLNGRDMPTPSEVNQMPLGELQSRQVIFWARGEDEATAIGEAKQRISESILNRVATKVSQTSDTEGDNIEGTITKNRLIESIESETLLDVQLSQPKVQNCSENNKNYIQVIYSITMGELIAQSVSKTRAFQDEYQNYLKHSHSASGVTSLLRSYPLISSLNKRNQLYNQAALRILKIKESLPDEATVRREVNSTLQGIKLNFSPAPPALNPMETLEGFEFEYPEVLTLSYENQPLVNLDLTLKITSVKPSYQTLKTDQIGQIKLSRISVKKGKMPIDKQGFVKEYCPKLSIELGAHDQVLELTNAQQLELKSYQFNCNSFSYVAFQKAKKVDKIEVYSAFLAEYPEVPESKETETLLLSKLKETGNYNEIYRFMKNYPTSHIVEKAELILYDMVTNVDSKEVYSRFLDDFPQSKKRTQVVDQLYTKVDQEKTWKGYLSFAKSYPDSSNNKSAIKQLSGIAMGMSETNLDEKEAKLNRLEVVEELATGKNSDSISKLKSDVEALRTKKLNNPITEDVRVMRMRSVSSPDSYFSAQLDASELIEGNFIITNLEMGMGYKQVAGAIVGLNINDKWKQPLRESYIDAQFRIFGKLADPVSFALGASYTLRYDNVELNDQESDKPDGTNKDGDSQYVNTEAEKEVYLTSIFKLPSYSTYFHLHVSNSSASAAAQYFVKPEISLVAEGYRHVSFIIDKRDTDTVANDDYQERKEDADSQRYNNIIGVKIVTLIEGFSTIRSKIFYSVLDEKAYLNLAVSF